MGQRNIRVNKQVQQIISEYLHTRLRDTMVCVTLVDVVVSPDLRKASIYYSVIGDAKKEKEIEKIFEKNKAALYRYVGREAKMKYTPELIFVLDHSIQRGSRIVGLLDGLDKSL